MTRQPPRPTLTYRTSGYGGSTSKLTRVLEPPALVAGRQAWGSGRPLGGNKRQTGSASAGRPKGASLDEPSSVSRLWEEFKLKASIDARERLILHYAPLVKYVAGRVSVGLPP